MSGSKAVISSEGLQAASSPLPPPPPVVHHIMDFFCISVLSICLAAHSIQCCLTVLCLTVHLISRHITLDQMYQSVLVWV